jgi:phosphoribosylaminoimidazolecarboxamide formyltransferase/IMP cyclohydrolase
MSDLVRIQRALLSVSNKTDLVPFARELAGQGVTLISTGGTARQLQEAGLEVLAIDQVTGFPEMMDGRVKTLHPKVHGGLLALRDDPKHQSAMTEHGIEPIDLICINLYPFEQTISREDVADAEAIEQIDIGGPSMIRSAAKNHRYVTVVTDPAQYDMVINELREQGGSTSLATREDLACAAFARTAAYDTAIAEWMSGRRETRFPQSLLVRMHCQAELRYGENPHQAGALYVSPPQGEPSVAHAKQLHGKQLSFNNLYDADGALELVKEVDPEQHAAAAVIKHANPCGFAVAGDLATAFVKAYGGDPLAAFGGIVALNRRVDECTASQIVEGQKFLEVIVAPDYDEAALEQLRQRWANARILQTDPFAASSARNRNEMQFKKIIGGMLVQDRDLAAIDPEKWEHRAGPQPDEALLRWMWLGMVAVKHLKSNAVCLVNDDMLVGGGAGQMDRLAACRIAVEKAAERAKGAVGASDAFFPFKDGPEALIEAGVRAIVQPGGSKRDEETVTTCESAGVTLMFTGQRHFRH